jgi:sulfur carrier protein
VITIVVNDTPRRIHVQTVAELVADLGLPARGIAVAVNGAVVRRTAWSALGLQDGDRVEVLTAAPGG